MATEGRILVMDPEPGILFVFSEALKALGKASEIVTAQNDLEALNEFRKQPCDLLIVDVTILDTAGIKLTESIKALNPQTAVIWITTHGCSNFASDLQRLGVISCHEKPMDIREILDMTVDALKKRREPA